MKPQFNIDRAVSHLSEAIRYKTISNLDPKKVDWALFDAFLVYLQNTYPNVHKTLKRELVNKYSPIYVWKGKKSNQKPILLIGHYDVVPVDEESLNLWLVPPFSGAIKNGNIYGRGALDNKHQVIAIMEAVEHLITIGFQPAQDIYIAIGFDEEVGGYKSAQQIADLFHQRKLEFEFVIDEGGGVVQDIIEGLTRPIAVIGVIEKSSVNLKITVTGKSGHSSTPFQNTTIDILANIITNVDNNPMPVKLIKPVQTFLESIAPYMGKQSVIMKNIKLLLPFVHQTLTQNPSINAILRTTIAFTKIEGGTALNVIPKTAAVYANARILPSETIADVIKHIKQVNKGIDFSIEQLNEQQITPVSPTNTSSYQTITGIIKDICPDVIPVPYLMAPETDSRKYYKVTKNVYRFSCMKMTKESFESIHSENEKISIDSLKSMIQFYIELIKRS